MHASGELPRQEEALLHNDYVIGFDADVTDHDVIGRKLIWYMQSGELPGQVEALLRAVNATNDFENELAARFTPDAQLPVNIHRLSICLSGWLAG